MTFTKGDRVTIDDYGSSHDGQSGIITHRDQDNPEEEAWYIVRFDDKQDDAFPESALSCRIITNWRAALK